MATLYKFDPHVHDMESSRCGKAGAAEMVEAYADKGYDGIIITDHFLNANTTADRSAPWEKQVATLVKGYEAAKKRGDQLGLKVFFAWEGGFDGNDFLTYGLDVDWLLENPDCASLPMKEYLKCTRAAGAYIVHAHPYRQANYIYCIRLLPQLVDAVETRNYCRTDLDNRLAWLYARAYGLPATAGSDAHCPDHIPPTVLETREPVNSVQDYIAMVKSGKIIIPELPGTPMPWEWQGDGNTQEGR